MAATVLLSARGMPRPTPAVTIAYDPGSAWRAGSSGGGEAGAWATRRGRRGQRALREPLGGVWEGAGRALLAEALAAEGGGAGGASAPPRAGGSGVVVAAGLAAGVACLTRYASVVLFPVG